MEFVSKYDEGTTSDGTESVSGVIRSSRDDWDVPVDRAESGAGAWSRCRVLEEWPIDEKSIR